MGDRPLQDLGQLRFPEGEKLFSQGDASDGGYLIVKGKIGLYQTIDGRRVHVRTLMAGELFGITAVVDGGVRSSTAVTVAPTVLVRIPASLLHQKLDRSDPFIRQIVGRLAEGMRDTQRAHQMRPRSIHDTVRLLQDQASNLRKFIINANIAFDHMDKLAVEVDRLDALIADIQGTVSGVVDRRSDVILDPDKLP